MAMTLLKNSTAPRPERRSFSRSLYDAIESNAGPSTIQQVISLLPATDDADKWNTASPDRVTQLLKSAETHGYVQYDEASQRWRLATRQWYEQRQAHIAELRRYNETKERLKPSQTPAIKAETLYGYSGQQLFLAHLAGYVGAALIALAAAGAWHLLGGG